MRGSAIAGPVTGRLTRPPAARVNVSQVWLAVVGAEGVNVAQVDIGAVRGVLIDGPRDVAARVVAQHVPRKEVGRRHMVLRAEVLVILAQVFVFL